MLFRGKELDSQARAPAVHKKLREHRQECLCHKSVKILEEQRAYGTEKSTDIR
jgi:hypothetical protein